MAPDAPATNGQTAAWDLSNEPVCSECAKPTKVTVNGRAYKHLYGPRKWDQDCQGSGQPWVTAAEAAKPCLAPNCRKPGTHRGLHDIPAGGPR